MKNFIEIVLVFLAAVAISVALSAMFAYPTMLLWNWLAPMLSKGFLPTLNFLQTWGLMVLISLLFPSRSSNNKENK